MDLQPTIQKIKSVARQVRLSLDRNAKAIESLKGQILSHPGEIRLRLQLAEAYFRARQIENAIAEYQLVADQYEKDNFILKAVAAYRNILKLCPDNPEVNLRLSELFLRANMTSEAVVQLKIAAEIFYVRRQNDLLIEVLQKLLMLDPQPGVRRRLAEIFHNVGKESESLEQLELLAREFRLNRQFDELLRVYEMILPRKPKNLALIKDVAILYLHRKDPDRALKIFDKYEVDKAPELSPVVQKAKLMKDLLRRQAQAGKTKN